MSIKTGDTVEIITGKDRSKRGKVIQVLSQGERIVVEGLNLMTKNVRAKRDREKGQMVQFNAPLQVSNVQLVCPKCGKRTRVGAQVSEGKKTRQCKKCKESFS